MPSARTLLRHVAVTMAVLFGIEVVANSVGGVTRQVLKGELSWWDRLTG